MEQAHTNDYFDPKVDTIDEYKEIFDFYCVAHAIEAGRQKALFLTQMGQTAYTPTLVSPTPLAELTLDQIMEKLTSHYKPDTVEIAERFKFFKHMQGEKDEVTEYMRKLAKTCNFGDYLNTALRDQLVCGLKDSRIQQELLCKKGLTLETALEKARAMEAVAKEVLTLHSGASPAQAAEDGDTHAIRKEEAKCYRCGSAGHLAPGCPHKIKCCNNRSFSTRMPEQAKSEEAQERVEENTLSGCW